MVSCIYTPCVAHESLRLIDNIDYSAPAPESATDVA